MFTNSFLRPFQKFIKIEAASSIYLLICTFLALFLANSPLNDFYQAWREVTFLGLTLHSWIDDGLMTLFFLLIGLEIKREYLKGSLSSWQHAALPIAAALGGMLVPASIYAFINFGKESLSGWGIPMATDIAFAIGILTLLGKTIPVALRVFLMALAIVDDLGAVIVIALFYTQTVSWLMLALGVGFLILLRIFTFLKITKASTCLLLGILTWLAFLKSGIHPTIAGVLLAFMFPNRIGIRFETYLHPWVSFGVMPLFALANAGLQLNGSSLSSPITLGIISGLVIGKQFGISLFSWLAIKLSLAKLPEGVRFFQLYGISWLGGIGFTMSLFIAHLAFDESSLINAAKLGILIGSVVSALVGAIFLKFISNELSSRTNLIESVNEDRN